MPPPADSSLRPPSTFAAPSPQPHPGKHKQLFTFKHEVPFKREGAQPFTLKQEVTRSSYSSSRGRYEDVGRSSSSRASAARRTRYDIGSGCRTSSFDRDGCTVDSAGTCRDGLHPSPSAAVWEPNGDDNTPAPFVAATVSAPSSFPLNAPAAAATLSAVTPAPHHRREGRLHFTNQKHKNNSAQLSASSPIRTSATVTATLAYTRGVGGRLGTPLGSPHPALEKRLGSSHPVPAMVSNAAKKAKLADTVGYSSAPGSHFFPPSMSVSTADCGGGSPVVFEMVQDAEDDEEDAIRRTSGMNGGQEGGPRELGWNGFTLYRYRLDIYQ